MEVPLSINELALLPREPTLLRRCGALFFPARISLFRLMTGVSANGSAIFVPSRFFSTCSATSTAAGLPSRLDSEVASSFDFRFRFGFSAGRIWTTSSLSPDSRADRRLRCPASVSDEVEPRRESVLSSCVFAFTAARGFVITACGSSTGTGSFDAFFERVFRVNWKPSASSSYAITTMSARPFAYPLSL